MRFGLSDTTIEKIKNVFSKYPELEKALIYGSRAKGNYKTGSDIDITFIGKELNKTILGKIEDEIDDLLLPYTFDLSIFDSITNPDFIGHVNRAAQVFYEKNVPSKDHKEHLIAS
jgi:predicted nucleotidyltransferase